MSKSLRFVIRYVLAIASSLLLLSFVSRAAAAQKLPGNPSSGGSSTAIAVLSVGSNGALQGTPLPSASLPSVTGVNPVWVDTYVHTLIIGWTEYYPDTCQDIDIGSFTSPKQPKYGNLVYTMEYHELSNGQCPGMFFPFNVARYTWGSIQTTLQDPFTLTWTSTDGVFVETFPFTAELAHLANSKAVWAPCPGPANPTLPATATLTLNNQPQGAINYAWTVTGATNELSYSNNTTATNTTTMQALAPSANQWDIGMKVAVTVANSNPPILTYGPLKTYVRQPNQLKSLPQMNHSAGTGASCSVPGNQGFISYISYEVDDQFQVNTYSTNNANVGINEKLGAVNPPPTAAENWSKGSEGGSPTSGGDFQDNVCTTGPTFNPQPLPPVPPLSNQLVITIPQEWFAGNSTNPATHQGCPVQTDTIDEFLDHGTHTGITTPLVQIASAVVARETSPRSTEPGMESRVTSHPTAIQNVQSLAEQSTVIVKGRVVKVNQFGDAETGSKAYQATVAFVRVDNVLKGSVNSNVIMVELSPEAISLAPDEYALLFLTLGHDERYVLADSQVGKMPITGQTVPLAEDAQATFDKLEAELFASLADPNPEVAKTALVQVGNLKTVRSTQAIREIAASGDPESQGLALATLIRLGDYSLLAQAISFAENTLEGSQEHFDSPALDGAGSIAYAIDLIGDNRIRAAREATRDPDLACPSRTDLPFDRSVLPLLHSLLSSTSMDLRRSATNALRGICDPSSARFLVGALDDSDNDVRYGAVMALGALEDFPADRLAPARGIFNDDPTKYLGNWKNWWEATGKLKYSSSR